MRNIAAACIFVNLLHHSDTIDDDACTRKFIRDRWDDKAVAIRTDIEQLCIKTSRLSLRKKTRSKVI